MYRENTYMSQKKSINVYDIKKRQMVYAPIEREGEYYSLSFLETKGFRKLSRSRGIFGLIVLLFIFPPLGFFLFGLFIFSLIFLGDREKMGKIAGFLPFLHYKKMQEFEVHDFLKRFPHLYKKGNDVSIPNSRNTQRIEEQDSKIRQMPDDEQILHEIEPEKNVEKYSQKHTTKKKEKTSTAIPKSVFDDYESVMDKFSKK